MANVVTFSFGGRKRRVVLEALETRVVVVDDPRRMALIGRPLYKFWARAPFECQAEVAVTDEQKGVLYYRAAQYRKALPHLVAAWRERPGPAIAQMALIAAACSGEDPAGLEDGVIADAVRADLARAGDPLFDRFGISSLYLDSLPYVAEEVEAIAKGRIVHEARASGDMCFVMGPDRKGEWEKPLMSLFLEPGWYRVILTARMDEGLPDEVPATLSFVDASGQVVHDSTTFALKDLAGPEYGEAECSLQITERLGPATLKIETAPGVLLHLDRLRIEPDVVRQIGMRDRLVRALLDGELADLQPEPQHLEPLLAYGNSAEAAGDVTRALKAYEKAAEADPSSYRPYTAMRRILDRLPEELRAAAAAGLDEVDASRAVPPRQNVFVRFKNGLVLSGYRLGAEEYAPGDELRLTLFWRVSPDDVRRYKGRWVFIHFIPEKAPKDEQAFQGDTAIVPTLRFNERLDRVEPVVSHPIKVGGRVKPGTYEIEVGVLIDRHYKRIRVLEADVPHTNNSATIGRVRIVPRRSPAGD